MDHKAFLRSLTAPERAALNAKSDAIGLAHLAVHTGLIGTLGTLIWVQVPLWWLLMLPQGILLVFLFTLLHETSHLTPFATRRINEWVGYACGFVLFLPANWFRYFHFAHHRYTQIPGKDPELASPKPQTRWAYIRHVSGLPIWAAHARGLWANAGRGVLGDYVPPARHRRVRFEARVMLVLYAAILIGAVVFGLPQLLTVWLIPLLLGQPFLRLYLLAEHGLCPTVASMFENTRTTRTNRILRKLAWNMPYHTEHHACPTVPFHRLADLHARMQAHLVNHAPGYRAFNADYRQSLSK